ncbi:hypothetical protein GW17_00022661 [Ensete ventricosum]|nr:hypothetical protein GW17_00022661 [Ensete ventricosum]
MSRGSMDLFASVELECHEVSASQEDRLLCSRFLNDNRVDFYSDSSSSPPHCASPSGARLSDMPYADSPVFFVSLPCTPSQTPAAPRDAASSGGILVQSSTPEGRTSTGADLWHAPTGEVPHAGRDGSGSPGGGHKEVRVSKKRLRGTQVSSTESTTESPPEGIGILGFGFREEPSKFDQQLNLPSNNPDGTTSDLTGRCEFRESPELLDRAIGDQDAASIISPPPEEGTSCASLAREKSPEYPSAMVPAVGDQNAASRATPEPRKLAASIISPPSEEGTSYASHAREKSSVNVSAMVSAVADDRLRMNLLDAIKMFAGKSNRRFTDTDILEIAKMKGIDFPPPWWSQLDGYDPAAYRRWSQIGDAKMPKYAEKGSVLYREAVAVKSGLLIDVQGEVKMKSGRRVGFRDIGTNHLQNYSYPLSDKKLD